jgi:hypothetical protein
MSVKLCSSDEPTTRETNVNYHIRYDAAKAIVAEQPLDADCARARQGGRAAGQGTRDTWTRSNWGRIHCLRQNGIERYLR